MSLSSIMMEQNQTPFDVQRYIAIIQSVFGLMNENPNNERLPELKALFSDPESVIKIFSRISDIYDEKVKNITIQLFREAVRLQMVVLEPADFQELVIKMFEKERSYENRIELLEACRIYFSTSLFNSEVYRPMISFAHLFIREQEVDLMIFPICGILIEHLPGPLFQKLFPQVIQLAFTQLESTSIPIQFEAFSLIIQYLKANQIPGDPIEGYLLPPDLCEKFLKFIHDMLRSSEDEFLEKVLQKLDVLKYYPGIQRDLYKLCRFLSSDRTLHAIQRVKAFNVLNFFDPLLFTLDLFQGTPESECPLRDYLESILKLSFQIFINSSINISFEFPDLLIISSLSHHQRLFSFIFDFTTTTLPQNSQSVPFILFLLKTCVPVAVRSLSPNLGAFLEYITSLPDTSDSLATEYRLSLFAELQAHFGANFQSFSEPCFMYGVQHLDDFSGYSGLLSLVKGSPTLLPFIPSLLQHFFQLISISTDLYRKSNLLTVVISSLKPMPETSTTGQALFELVYPFLMSPNIILFDDDSGCISKGLRYLLRHFPEGIESHSSEILSFLLNQIRRAASSGVPSQPSLDVSFSCLHQSLKTLFHFIYVIPMHASVHAFYPLLVSLLEQYPSDPSSSVSPSISSSVSPSISSTVSPSISSSVSPSIPLSVSPSIPLSVSPSISSSVSPSIPSTIFSSISSSLPFSVSSSISFTVSSSKPSSIPLSVSPSISSSVTTLHQDILLLLSVCVGLYRSELGESVADFYVEVFQESMKHAPVLTLLRCISISGPFLIGTRIRSEVLYFLENQLRLNEIGSLEDAAVVELFRAYEVVIKDFPEYAEYLFQKVVGIIAVSPKNFFRFPFTSLFPRTVILSICSFLNRMMSMMKNPMHFLDFLYCSTTNLQCSPSPLENALQIDLLARNVLFSNNQVIDMNICSSLLNNVINMIGRVECDPEALNILFKDLAFVLAAKSPGGILLDYIDVDKEKVFTTLKEIAIDELEILEDHETKELIQNKRTEIYQFSDGYALYLAIVLVNKNFSFRPEVGEKILMIINSSLDRDISLLSSSLQSRLASGYPIPQTPIPQTQFPQTPIPQTPIPQTSIHQTSIHQTSIHQTSIHQTSIPQTQEPSK